MNRFLKNACKTTQSVASYNQEMTKHTNERKSKMKIYYQTKSKGRCGCNNYSSIKVTEDYKTKTALKKHYSGMSTMVVWMCAEEQLVEKYGNEKAEQIKKEAVVW